MRYLVPLTLVSCLIGGMAPSEAQTVYISEFMASNQDSLSDEDGDSPDWIELFNAGSTPVDLDGWYLTDDPALLTQWQIPGVTLPAGQFILIFASDKDRRDPAAELHTNFKLSAGGDYLALVQADGITVEHDYGPSYPAQITDVSYGVGMSGGSSILIGQGDPLRYKIPTGGGDDVDDGLNPDPWIGTGFNDASWSAGALGIGYARSEPDAYDQYILTDLESQMDGVHPGVYVRVEFEVADPSAVQGLNLRMRYDDGFVAYLNGQPEPVAAANAPASPTISWQSSATATRSDSSAVGFQDFQIGDPPLVPGTNVLAIHGLNASSGSSDLLVSPQLVASTDAALNGEVNYFTTPTPDATNSDASASPGPLVKGVPKTVAPPSAGATPVSIPITAEVSATLHPLASVVLKHRVMYDNEIEVPMVDDGSGDDAAAGDGVFTGTISTGDLSAGEMLRWRVVATDTQGNPTRVPPFPDPLDSPEYCGTVALDPSTASSLLPVLHWFASNPGGANSRSGTRSSVYFLGEFYDNILTDLHGQSTSGFPKKSYDFDFNAGDRFRWRDGEKRVKDLNLLTNWADKSKARNTLAYEVLRDTGAPYHFAFAVRVQQNGSFFSTADMVEDGDDRMLERNGLDPDGAFYKVYNSLDSTSGASKKTRKGEGSGDLQALINGLGQSGDAKVRFGYDNVNIPAAVNYHAAIAIYCNRDHGHKNYYVYRDTDGSGEWFPIAWDVDLSFGRNWGPNYFVDNLTGATNSLTPGSQNRLYNLIYNTPEFQQMYYRRIKTVADKILQAPGTVDGKLEQRVNELLAQIDPPGVTSDADLDYAKWGSWGNGNHAAAASQRLIDEFLDASGGTDRRDYLYTTLAGTIPPSQPAMAPVSISMGEFNPASGDQDEEYFTLSHSNAYATDISGWRIDGAVRMDIPAGTVIPAGMTLYVGRDALAFRGRATSPKGDEKRFLISGYGGQLSARGETIELYDELGNLIDSLSYTGSPTELQKWLRITELMFNPAGPSLAELATDPDLTASDFEFVELRNTGPSSLDISGAQFVAGIAFTLPAATVLAAGESIVAVSNPAAFALRYGGVPRVAGAYTGQLGNGGEELQLIDSVGENVLEFTFADDWYWPADGSGYSLVVRDASQAFSDWELASHWAISAESGGSPAAGDTEFSTLFSIWKEGAFSPTELVDPTISGDGADWDHDGLSTVGEYGLALDPTVSDAESFPAASVVADGGTDYLALTFRRQKRAADLAYAVEVGDGPGVWSGATLRVGDSVDHGDGTETVTFRDSVPIGERPQRFIRLRMLLTPAP